MNALMNTRVVITSISVLLILTITLLLSILYTCEAQRNQSGKATVSVSSKPPSHPRAGEVWVNPKDGSLLIWIPGGEFVMGNEKGKYDQRPAHRVKVRGFWLGKYEVTNEQYAKFLKATGYREPDYWDDSRFNHPKQPVTGIRFLDALEYCRWAKLRLATEAEWEYAAKAGKQLRYPTATGALNHNLANYFGTGGRDRWKTTSPVGSFPPNPFGIHDMAGNAWEWCSSLYKPYPYSLLDGRENLGILGFRVMRGGSWDSLPDYCTSTYRHYHQAHLRYDFSGIRVAR